MQYLTPKEQVYFQLLQQLLAKASLNKEDIEFANKQAQKLANSVCSMGN